MKKFLLQNCKKVLVLILFSTMLCTSVGTHWCEVYAANEPKVEINGFKISTTLGGFRTIYSISDPASKIESCGLVYGLEGLVTESEMVVESDNEEVYAYKATEAGKSDICYSKLDSAVSYAMTMLFVDSKEFYEANMMVRAYAELSNGDIVYSDVVSASVFSVAEYLYNHDLMGTKAGHTYLYNNILSVVNSEYLVRDYDWTGNIVAPGKLHGNTDNYTVQFVDYDGSVISTQKVNKGESATAPTNPRRTGYIFIGWDKEYSNVTENIIVTAQYNKITAPTFIVDSVEVSAGAKDVEVTIAVLNNPGISSIGMNVEFDESLTLTTVKYNSEIGGQSIQPSNFDSPTKLIWVSPFADAEDDWTFVTLTFDVADTAQVGELPVNITYNANDVYDMTENNIAFDIIDGAIIVK